MGLSYTLSTALLSITFLVCSCVTVPGSILNTKVEERPPEISEYYKVTQGYTSFKEVVLKEKKRFNTKEIKIETPTGQITITYFQRPEPSANLILIFPVLGGKNIIENYFGRYFAGKGYDSAIVHRSNDFKNIERFYELEQIFKDGLVRDRIALDFFEKEYGKKKFGSFGISRGAINVAMTAGVDPRLKYNVLALGGTDMVSIFRDSDQPGIKKYRKKVMERYHLTKEQFFEELKKSIRTDPKNLAQYMDPKNTMLLLAVFDQTVPFKFGMRLRRQLNKPKTVFILAGHYTALAYTQFTKMVRPNGDFSSFPLDYIETQALEFYDKSFGVSRVSFRRSFMQMISFPFQALTSLLSPLF